MVEFRPAILNPTSTTVASFEYNTANHPEMLPRKPQPKHQATPSAAPSTSAPTAAASGR